jgi:PleD family two-component response regulator
MNTTTTEIPPPVEENVEEKADEKQGLRVLLVEDNEINLKLLIATMRKLNLEHATATNGLEAFNSYKEKHGKFDVVFMGTPSLPPPSSLPS